MTIVTINTNEDHSQYIAQVYQEQYARLRHYFRKQLGDSVEVEACIHETIRRFFFFMEDHDWETEAEYITVYIMRIAWLVCSRKLEENKSNCEAGFVNENDGSFEEVRVEAGRNIKERFRGLKNFLGLPMHGGGYPSRA